ncbi:MAG TPA: DNA-3-methyladenine glycosylase [Gemmatimonadaceae bacterium]|jgi:3-methyladenine DNA glycosylase/8-oxoguanine DNA glycosylase
MSHKRAITHLRKADPRLSAVIDAVGSCTFAPAEHLAHFTAISRSIVFQQLSGKAATTIYNRFAALFPDETPTAKALSEISDEQLRGVGLSRQKTGYLRDFAARVNSGEVPIDSLHELSDEEIIKALVSVKGIGRWTAQMFLMFRLGRPDVLPDLDLGIQKGIQRAYRMRKLPTPKRVMEIGAKWAPHRTIASWYLWRSLDATAESRQGK